jgi:hypothetical protein
MNTQRRIPTEEALLLRIKAEASDLTQKVKNEVGFLEQQYTRFKHRQRISVLLIAIAFLLPNIVTFLLDVVFAALPQVVSDYIAIGVTVFSIILCGGYALRLFFKGRIIDQQFHNSIDQILFHKAFKVLGIKGRPVEMMFVPASASTESAWWKKLYYAHIAPKQSPETTKILSALQHSELMTVAHTVSTVDTIFSVVHETRELTLAELQIQSVDKKGDATPLFKGYFMEYPLTFVLKGKTFISTEGDYYGFGHRTYWDGLTSGSLKETIIGWSDFEQLLHVAATDEQEARTLLTPDFIKDLYKWWKPLKRNIRLSFVGQSLYMLFPDEYIQIDETVARITEVELEQYLKTITVPLLHIMHLVEDVWV